MSEIIGADDLIRKLGSLADVSEDELTESIKKWTEYVRGESVDIVPVRTGELRDSIKTDVTTAGGDIEGIVYTNKDYGPAVELGIGQEAQPYLYPAINNNIKRITDGIAADIGNKIEGVAGNG